MYMYRCDDIHARVCAQWKAKSKRKKNVFLWGALTLNQTDDSKINANYNSVGGNQQKESKHQRLSATCSALVSLAKKTTCRRLRDDTGEPLQ